MKSSRPPSFSRALRAIRNARGLPQEAFDLVSSRTYVSALERNLKEPTLSKVTELAMVCKVHPLTMLALSYCASAKPAELDRLMARVKKEVEELGLSDI